MNRVLISMQDGLAEPEWIGRAHDFELEVLDKLGFDGKEFSILFCSDSFIQALNKSYRGIDSPTDILSFENGSSYTDEDGAQWLCAGDIIISLDTLPRNSRYFNVSQDEELKRLLVHGTLHLSGMDHGDEHVESGVEPESPMLRKQEKILKELESRTLLQTV